MVYKRNMIFSVTLRLEGDLEIPHKQKMYKIMYKLSADKEGGYIKGFPS